MSFPDTALRRTLAVALLAPSLGLAQEWEFRPPGELKSPPGVGARDTTIYAPGIRFPIEAPPAYANSQVYSSGGFWSHPSNYQYPWVDTFCETRSWRTDACPAGRGHQGQDLRPATKSKDAYYAVAAEDGQVVYLSSKGGWKLSVRGDRTRNIYNYLHLNMDRLLVSVGDRVKAGQRLGLISNYFGGTATSVHLHFEVQQAIQSGGGYRFVPPYMSLVRSYERLIAVP